MLRETDAGATFTGSCRRRRTQPPGVVYKSRFRSPFADLRSLQVESVRTANTVCSANSEPAAVCFVSLSGSRPELANTGNYQEHTW
jgi:hypothetical protein